MHVTVVCNCAKNEKNINVVLEKNLKNFIFGTNPGLSATNPGLSQD